MADQTNPIADAAKALLDAWAAFKELAGDEERDAVCSVCGRHPCGQLDHADDCPMRVLSVALAGLLSTAATVLWEGPADEIALASEDPAILAALTLDPPGTHVVVTRA